MRLRRLCTTVAALTVLAGGGAVTAAADDPGGSSASKPRAGEQERDRHGVVPEGAPGADEAQAAPGKAQEQPPTAETCSEPDAEGRAACLEPNPVDPQELPQDIVRMRRAAVDPPSWCPTEDRKVLGTRSKVCKVEGWSYWTRKRINGRWVKTGETKMIFLNYSYGDSGIGRVAHQIEVYATRGWGDTLKAKIGGKGAPSASCKTESAKFPGQKLALHKWMVGEAFFDTTATAPGAMGKCGTGWSMKITNAPYKPVVIPGKFKEFRCDNATGGRPIVGCVVPWYASDLRYSKARIPDVARHITLAQASGLPKRLKRTTDESIRKKNRRLACGDRPAAGGKNCDEYPLASSSNGLSAGGKRRTFDGCSYSDIPSGTGAKGASACAVRAAQNSSQGGTTGAFYRDQRVLDGDPFDVVIIP
ncbi:hypothetical protein GCM10010252_26830 [Streptomyces aureoverticillatus]|nr:hypothetical protein GCM10010252_26830 [Streptomyces aureoverticillatus]